MKTNSRRASVGGVRVNTWARGQSFALAEKEGNLILASYGTGGTYPVSRSTGSFISAFAPDDIVCVPRSSARRVCLCNFGFECGQTAELLLGLVVETIGKTVEKDLVLIWLKYALTAMLKKQNKTKLALEDKRPDIS
ncbi:hypothetical protein CDAR_232721 [Caerostris darwini]|uniref:Uncharacterized protein n=1 Tax=Caerostris darwini TaxID=1538125 RepID=A0AAV4UNY7_9ARAC|nr:hypothetical protein CDAR_232721 [Caerostris darwini]